MSTGGPSNTNQLGLDQSTTAQGTAGGNHPGMGGPPNTNQLGIDQTGGQNSAGTQSFNSGTGQGTTGVSGGGATAYNDGGLATGRAAQGNGAPGGQAGNMPGMPAKMQSKMDEVKNKVMEQGEKQKQAN
ncbi:hypothetical protein WJX79_002929 [Trebouxia sp. C0005]|nr:MAG: hypothetical protein FRX49_09115 [Trebouxia sp. A1-2]